MYKKFVHNTNTQYQHFCFRVCSKWQLLSQAFCHNLNLPQSQKMLLWLPKERFPEKLRYLLLQLPASCGQKLRTKVKNCRKFKIHMDTAPVLCDIWRCTVHVRTHFWMKTSRKPSRWWKNIMTVTISCAAYASTVYVKMRWNQIHFCTDWKHPTASLLHKTFALWNSYICMANWTTCECLIKG